MKLTKHARDRISQRCRIKGKSKQENSYRLAIVKGFNREDFKDEFRQYLNSKIGRQKDKKLKVYDNHIYLYSSKNKKLITVLNIPEEYEDWKSYLEKPIKLKDNKPIIRKYKKNKESYINELENIRNKLIINNPDEILKLIENLEKISQQSEQEKENYKEYQVLTDLINHRVNKIKNMNLLLTSSYNKANSGEIDLSSYNNQKFYKCRISDIVEYLKKEDIK